MGEERVVPVTDVDDDGVAPQLVDPEIGRSLLWRFVRHVGYHGDHRSVRDGEHVGVVGEVVVVPADVAVKRGQRVIGEVEAHPVDGEPLAAVEAPTGRHHRPAV